MDLDKTLLGLGACADGRKWARGKTAADAWRDCQRGDWMLWVAAKLADRKPVVLAACAVAREALQHVPTGEKRPLRAIETAEAWCRGKVTIGAVRQAANAAYAAYAAYASNAAYAAYASDDAYDDASADSAYAAAASDAASAAADAAYAAYASDDAYAASLARSAEIVREMIPFAMIDIDGLLNHAPRERNPLTAACACRIL